MELLIKRKKLEQAFKAQIKHLKEREKELKGIFKTIKPSKKNFWFSNHLKRSKLEGLNPLFINGEIIYRK